MGIRYESDVRPVSRLDVEMRAGATYDTMKYTRLSVAQAHGNSTQRIVLNKLVECMEEIAPGRQDLLVDMKYYLYHEGDRLMPPGTGLWHPDVSLDPHCPGEQDHHLLWQMGNCGGFTEFLDQDVELYDVPGSAAQLDWEMDRYAPPMVAGPCVIYHYGPGQLHRAVAPTGPGHRMLVRLTATSRIRR